MGIFRRHTDEVFSTLQQVQRRISSQSGTTQQPRPSTEEEIARAITPEPPSVEDAPRPVSEPVDRPGPASYPGPAHPAGGPVTSSAPAAPAAASVAASGAAGAAPAPSFPAHDPSVPRRGITLSPEAIGTLLCLWIFTVVGAYMLGGRGGTPAAPEPGPPAGTAAMLDGEGAGKTSRRRVELPDERDLGTARRAAPGVDHTPGDHVLVLQSSANAKAATREHLEGLAAKYNASAAMDENRRRGLKPLFGVRYPSGGGIQFVFGARGDEFGIPKDDALAKDMEQILKKTFADAFWLKVK